VTAQRQLELAHVGHVSRTAVPATRLYFAFGSNLDLAQMARRCPRARVSNSASLPGFELVFAGYSPSWRGAVASVNERERATVRGLLYTLDDADFAMLDRYEGHPHWYLRHYVWVRPRGARKLVRAETYLLDAELGEPSRVYLEQIARAYREHGFSLAPLLAAARRCITEER
jgi:hypothetical protein